MLHWFMLDDDHRVVETSRDEAVRQVESDRHRVRLTGLKEVDISTVFICVSHSTDDALFETAVFKSDGDSRILARYFTWDAAVKGHEDLVEEISKEIEEAIGDASRWLKLALT